MPDLDDTALESLSKKIAKALGRAPVEDDDGDDEPRGNGRAQERIRALVADKKRAAAELAELASEVEAVKTAHAAELKKAKEAFAAQAKELRDAAAAEVTTVRQRAEIDVELVQRGLNDRHGRRAFYDAYEDIPADKRPASPLAYLEQLDAAAEQRRTYLADPKAEREKAPASPLSSLPRTLHTYLADRFADPAAPAAEPEKAATITPPRVGAKAPRIDDGRRPPSTSTLMEEIRTLAQDPRKQAEYHAALARLDVEMKQGA
jgi:translation elongation factor EF-1beta